VTFRSRHWLRWATRFRKAFIGSPDSDFLPRFAVLKVWKADVYRGTPKGSVSGEQVRQKSNRQSGHDRPLGACWPACLMALSRVASLPASRSDPEKRCPDASFGESLDQDFVDSVPQRDFHDPTIKKRFATRAL